ncbi:EF-hand calcium-binding domain-containing protein 14 isoform X2 [Scyliorhinus canicula]|uniref:EF-hand calcium-binding domain-containing protein 14 isoform X2 n=1 Tax=Scyliorhinus canicula TaxID=7830 RepID=UPI0018F33C5F|nr:EF-hand calcium-binding domain-containing protein 14 isoform X2 [Scyliorhinus canicula]
MKKRKELNALIGLTGDGKKKKPKKSSGHQLLLRPEATATDSESTSEFDEFAQPASNSLFTKRGYIRCCKICYPLCAFVMLAACVVACVGLVWMQVALKEDLDALKEKFRTLESSQKTSFSDIPKLSEDLLAVQKDLTNIDTGDQGISKIWTNITELNKQISQLNSAVAHLKANVKSASDLINLPVTVEELQKSVATIGSTLTSVQHDVDTIRNALENQKKIVETLQQNKDILDLHDQIEAVNATLAFYHTHNDQKLHHIDLEVNNISQRITLLESNLLIASNANKIENVNGSLVAPTNNSQEIVSSDQQIAFKEQKPSGLNNLFSSAAYVVCADVNHGHWILCFPLQVSLQPRIDVLNLGTRQNDSSQLSNLRERLKIMVNALTSKPDNIGNTDTIISQGNTSSTSTVKPLVSSTLPIKAITKKNNKRNVRLKRLSLPGINNLKALQDMFLKSNDGQLSYEDLHNLFGIQTPKPEEMQPFDLNEDGRFSQSELSDAFDP